MADNYVCEKPISVSVADLEEKGSNLKFLSYFWGFEHGETVCTIGLSKGYSANVVDDCLNETTYAAAAMQALLDNSIAFFESVGIRFEDADVRSMQEIIQIN